LRRCGGDERLGGEDSLWGDLGCLLVGLAGELLLLLLTLRLGIDQ